MGMPLRVLAVAEKPSVAKELAEILSGRNYRTSQGAARYNRLFEFSLQLSGRPCQMTITSVRDGDGGRNRWREGEAQQLVQPAPDVDKKGQG
eukprot:scaffold124615_cov30-Tisochrysis_lutea.AAC.1